MKDRLNVAFVLDHKLHHYRVPFFNFLVEKGYSITVFHKGPPLSLSASESKVLFEEKFCQERKFGPFRWRKSSSSLSSYDIVVSMQNIRYIDFILSTLNYFRKYKLIHWGIGVSSASGLKKQNKGIVFFRNLLTYTADATVYYSDYALNYISPKNRNKSFVAHNTVLNSSSQDLSNHNKDSLLFIGTLNKRKGIDILLRAFAAFLAINSGTQQKIKQLNIVGDGEDTNRLKKLCQELQIENKVKFFGRITNFDEKRDLYSRALVCISPKQAGLAVLESFSYGVPFIAFTDAISGGEHLNIQNNYNGFLVDSEEELGVRIDYLVNNPEIAAQLGTNAFIFYKEERSITNMTDGFISAFNHVLK